MCSDVNRECAALVQRVPEQSYNEVNSVKAHARFTASGVAQQLAARGAGEGGCAGRAAGHAGGRRLGQAVRKGGDVLLEGGVGGADVAAVGGAGARLAVPLQAGRHQGVGRLSKAGPSSCMRHAQFVEAGWGPRLKCCMCRTCQKSAPRNAPPLCSEASTAPLTRTNQGLRTEVISHSPAFLPERGGAMGSSSRAARPGVRKQHGCPLISNPLSMPLSQAHCGLPSLLPDRGLTKLLQHEGHAQLRGHLRVAVHPALAKAGVNDLPCTGGNQGEEGMTKEQAASLSTVKEQHIYVLIYISLRKAACMRTITAQHLFPLTVVRPEVNHGIVNAGVRMVSTEVLSRFGGPVGAVVVLNKPAGAEEGGASDGSAASEGPRRHEQPALCYPSST